MKVMAIDYGDARTGIAVSDLRGTIVGSTSVIHSRNSEKTLDHICEIAKEKQVDLVFVAPDDPLVGGLVDACEAAGIRLL